MSSESLPNINNENPEEFTTKLKPGEQLLDVLHEENIAPSIKEKLDKHSELVNETYNIFKSEYGNAFRNTLISSIINGEIIETKPENIFIEQDLKFNDPTFEEKCKYCTKNLYTYQKNAIKKIRELELRGYNVNAHTGKKIVSNGWLLSLPIGSGKSIVFQFLALFYRDIPQHPIIISTDGKFIPEHDQMQFKYYPFFYENCAYDEDTANGVTVLENYTQRPCTVILTHIHLMQQMKMYFEQDFPVTRQIPGKRPVISISYNTTTTGLNPAKYDIIVIPATQQNINDLVKWSWEQPFLRVIIDDYTSMPSIDSFRQILATSTIFVSGSGFERKFEDIPASYYTMKFLPVSQMSLVGRPEETLEGIFRDSIATMELLGSHCEFSQYEFVMDCEEFIKQRFHTDLYTVYPFLRKEMRLSNYFPLMFIIKYYDRIKSAIITVEKDLAVDKKTKTSKLSPSKVKYYLEWKKIFSDVERNPPKPIVRKFNGNDIKLPAPASMNPLYCSIYDDARVGNNSGSALVTQACMSCAKKFTDHNGYGMVACCCGAFYCSACMKCMTTRCICDKETCETLYDNDNYYCCCCREKNPTYHFNVNRKKDTNVYSYNLVHDFFDTSDLNESIHFDYYFYMFLRGFKPLYHEGKPLNIHLDITQGCIKRNCFIKKTIPTLEKILPKDQLGIYSLKVINKTLAKLNILPSNTGVILIYGCPRYMVQRVMDFYKTVSNSKDSSTMLPYNGQKIQPLSLLTIEYKDSVASLIGIHKNIVAIIQWETPDKKDELNQLIGRILRLSNFNNKLYFYISTNSIGWE